LIVIAMSTLIVFLEISYDKSKTPQQSRVARTD
jgi:hypothetical protein